MIYNQWTSLLFQGSGRRSGDCNTYCLKVWPNLRAKWIWVFKRCDRRIFVQSDIEALIALRDTDKPLGDTANDLLYQQKERLEGSNEIEIAIPDTYNNLPHYPNQLKEFLTFLADKLAAHEMNVQLTEVCLSLKQQFPGSSKIIML